MFRPADSKMSIQTVEKSNCHLHFAGALEMSFIRERAGNIDLFEPLEQYRDFEHPLLWELARRATYNPDDMLDAMSLIIKTERADNVTYLELTCNPVSTVRSMGQNAYLDIILEIERRGREIGLEFRTKVGINRRYNKDERRIAYRVFDALPSSVAWGLDLNGDERLYPAYEAYDELTALSRMGVSVSIHAGEFPSSVDSLERAIIAGPLRVGHAVASLANERYVQMLLDKGITVEVAPKSNLCRGVVDEMGRHPVGMFIEAGVPVVFGSDDPLFFDASMSDNLELLGASGMTQQQILAINEEASRLARARIA